MRRPEAAREPERFHAEAAVDQRADQVADPNDQSFEARTAPLGIENRVQDAPHRVSAQPDGQDEQHRVAEGVRQDHPQRAARVGDGPAPVQRGRSRQQADGGVDERLRRVPEARKRLDHQRRALLKKRS